MRKIIIAIITVNLIVSIFILIVNRETERAITYFPLHPEITIDQAFTSLQATPKQQSKNILLEWFIQSRTDDALYLRQDISLLFENGYLIDVINIWKQTTALINEQKTIERRNNKLFQTISFHYGEIHDHGQAINSTQLMSYDQLYTIYCNRYDKTSIFKQPKNFSQKQHAKLLDEQINGHLQMYWQRLMNEYDIDPEKYYQIPLIDLENYNEQPLPRLSQAKTNQVIGQLWEGLYKNYIIPMSKQKSMSDEHFMPLILFDRKATHLLVIYKLNGKPEQLRQNIS